MACKDKFDSCLECTADDGCTNCVDGYFVKDKQCLACTSIGHCLTCDKQGQCTGCEKAYFLADDNTCSNCNDKFEKCNDCDKDTCNSCEAKYFL